MLEKNGRKTNLIKKENANPGDLETLAIRKIRKRKLLENCFGFILAIIIRISLIIIQKGFGIR